jgi:hypothetical protein
VVGFGQRSGLKSGTVFKEKLMRGSNNQNRWQQVRGKRRPHWSILTLDDLHKTNRKYSRLIVQLQTRYQVLEDQGKDKPNQKSGDYSI